MFVGKTTLLELLGEFRVEDLLEDVLEAAVIGFQDRVLGRQIDRIVALQPIGEAGVGELADRGVLVVHGHGHAGADVVLNGLGFEPWAGKLLKSSGYKGETVTAAKGVKARAMQEEKGHSAHAGHAHKEMDPHAWQNPNHVALYVRNIAAGLAKVDAAGAATYQANAEAYVKELQALDTWAQAQIATIPADKRKVITSHDAFGYFAAQYGVKFLAPQGLNTEAEPSAKQVAQLIKQIQREKIRAVFVENMSNPKLIAQLSKDAGATLGASLYADALSTVDQPGATYLQMMRHNVTQLVAGMKRN